VSVYRALLSMYRALLNVYRACFDVQGALLNCQCAEAFQWHLQANSRSPACLLSVYTGLF